jgi:hypothetical protein
MEEQKVGDDSIGEYFEKITSIKVSGDLIFVTGHPKASSPFYVVVGKISGSAVAPTWKAIKIAKLATANKANDMLALNDYLYIVGNNGDAGWISATPISLIKNCVKVATGSSATEGSGTTGSDAAEGSGTTGSGTAVGGDTIAAKDTYLDTVDYALYAIDGRS